MPELRKAQLIELQVNDNGSWTTMNGGKTISVQFNPESLRVSYSNQVKWPGAGDQRGTAAIQFVGTGTTKLAVTLWFDSSTLGSPADDVRKQTQTVAYFIEPAVPAGQDANSASTKARAVRFEWGTFKFEGIMDTLEETLEFFAPDGTPIRASVAFTLSKNRIQFLRGEKGASAGTTPLTPAPQGKPFQQVAAASGAAANWQSIAAANNIENPRMLATGQLFNMSASLDVGASVSGGVGITAGAGIGAGATASAAIGAGVVDGGSAFGGVAGGGVVTTSSVASGTSVSGTRIAIIR